MAWATGIAGATTGIAGAMARGDADAGPGATGRDVDGIRRLSTK